MKKEIVLLKQLTLYLVVWEFFVIYIMYINEGSEVLNLLIRNGE